MEQSSNFVINAKGVLTAYKGDEEVMTIPDGVKIIGESIIGHRSGEQVKKVIIPEGVTEIKQSAFSSSKICEVVFPSTLQKIGKWAFSDCKQLKTVCIPEGTKEIAELSFRDSGLEEVHLPDSIETKKKMAFANCRDLKEINLPHLDTLKIEECAFQNCKALVDESGLLIIQHRLFAAVVKEDEKPAKVHIPENVKHIETGCLNLFFPLAIDMPINCPSWTFDGRPLLWGNGSSISFRNPGGEKVAYVVLAFEDETGPKKDAAMYSLKSENGKFDFEHYDSVFGILAKTPNKARIALARIEYPYELSEEMENVYKDYLKKQSIAAGKILIDEN